MKKVDFLFLSLLIILAFIFRLYKIDIPLADLHSWRQADTAAVARNFVKDGFDLLHPRFDDLSSNQSTAGLENPQGWRFVEFPFYNAIFAYFYTLFPQLPLEVWGRLTTAFFSLIIITIIYYLVLKEVGRIAAFFSSLIYAVFPFFVFFSRVVLPETTAVALSMISIFFLYQFSNIKKTSLFSIFYFLFSIIFFSLSLLVKPTTIFYSLPLFFLFLQKYRLNIFGQIPVYLFFLLSFTPFFLWRWYIQKFPEGIPPFEWLITSVNTSQGLQKIFFRPAFFRWIFFERLNNLILGGYLTVFLILGVINRQKKLFLHSILLSSFLYLLIFQGGNVQHEYYQTIILPAVAIAVGLGTAHILSYKKVFLHPLLSYLTILILFVFSFFFSYYKVRDFYFYPKELPQIAKIISTLTKPDDKIVTDRMGDTTLLYLSQRKGAPSIYKPPTELKKSGYRYLVTLNQEEIKKLKEANFEVVFENDQFALFKL
ncbi:MAG: glycosyltransferase family 39 protein [Microgenomates group bacterium]